MNGAPPAFAGGAILVRRACTPPRRRRAGGVEAGTEERLERAPVRSYARPITPPRTRSETTVQYRFPFAALDLVGALGNCHGPSGVPGQAEGRPRLRDPRSPPLQRPGRWPGTLRFRSPAGRGTPFLTCWRSTLAECSWRWWARACFGEREGVRQCELAQVTGVLFPGCVVRSVVRFLRGRWHVPRRLSVARGGEGAEGGRRRDPDHLRRCRDGVGPGARQEGAPNAGSLIASPIRFGVRKPELRYS